MPELPEAETIARGLRPMLEGRTILDARVVHEDVLPRGAGAFRAKVRGRTITGVGRRGKNLVLSLDDASVILINLGMTGKLLPLPASASEADERGAAGREVIPTHPAIRFRLDDGGSLVYDDVRRFGRVEALAAEKWRERSRRLGPEPLEEEFGSREMMQRLGASRSPIRNVLLDQQRLAGVGNIYANEALHRAKIHPRRPAESLDQEAFARLHGVLREVLTEAIRAEGTTIRDYRNASGRPGRYSRQLQVYDREGQACLRCGETIERIVFGNRSAFLCPRCQPMDPDRASN